MSADKMVLTRCLKTGFFMRVKGVICLTLVVCLSCIGVMSFWSSSVEKKSNIIGSNQTGDIKFVYSNSVTYRTIIGVKNSLCFDYKNRTEAVTKRRDCKSTRVCNAFKKAGENHETLPSGCKQRLPRCIIIGVYKAGTRELIDFLAMHPGIVIRREPFYEISLFSSSRYRYGMEWYRKEMPYSMQDQITIEKSPGYFQHPLAPERIRQMDPNVRLILMVREPVQRAISHFTFSQRNATAKDIEENVKIRTPEGKLTGLFRYSLYDEAFENYLRFFNRSQILIIDSDVFKRNPRRVVSETEAFLGLPHMIKKNRFVFNEEKGFYCLRRVGRRTAACFGDERGRKAPKADMKSVKPLLRDIFKQHNRRFFELTGKTFQWT